MKINVIRNLIIPWFVFFIGCLVSIVVAGIHFPQLLEDPMISSGALAGGIFLCLVLNIRTLSKAGIWIAHSLPSSLRYNSKPWIFRAFQAAAVAFGFYLLGQFSWIPLIWQAFVIPIVFSVTLFVGVWSLMGPILTWSSRVSFSRVTAFLSSLPVFAMIPVTALFLGKTIVSAYLTTHPQVIVNLFEQGEPESGSEPAALVATTEKLENKEIVPVASSEKAKSFQAMAESGKPCSEGNKDILASLQSIGPEDTVYWAIKALKCSDLTSVMALPKLAKVMADHPSAVVRTAAIRGMSRYGAEKLKSISYLIIKRISEKEAPEVVHAASAVMAKMGEEDRKFAIARLKALLDSEKSSFLAARVLVEDLKREEVVTEFVVDQLMTGKTEDKGRAVALICVLPQASRTVAEPHLDEVVALVRTGGKEDPAMQALNCMGHSGFQAIRKEVVQPQKLNRPVAARALAELNVKSAGNEALETAENCVRDEDLQVRKWCSQSLGKIGAPALPKILDLLKSNDRDLKEAGRNALNYFDDPNARQELEKVRDENSGWMANKSKLSVAEAVNSALIKIHQDERGENSTRQ